MERQNSREDIDFLYFSRIVLGVFFHHETNFYVLRGRENKEIRAREDKGTESMGP